MPRDPTTGRLRPLTGKEAMDRHIALVQYDHLGLLLNRDQKQIVYHYTNVVGLRGIIDSGTMWASDHQFLNDSSEIKFGLQILEMMIASRHGAAEHFDVDLRKEVLMAIAMMQEGRLGSYVFTASFCQRGNLLSQWRAYSSADGVAIAFNREALEKQAALNSFVCGYVHYYFSSGSGNSFTLWLEGEISLLHNALKSIPIDLQSELAEEEQDLFDVLAVGRRREKIDEWILQTAAFIKHPAFDEEREWRCLYISNRNRQSRLSILDRPSRTSIIPYVSLNLGHKSDTQLCISGVVIGPNPDGNVLERAVDHMLVSRGLLNSGVMIPYNPLRML